MALVQVKQMFRVGLLQNVSRYVSPPSGRLTRPTSFRRKSDPMSRQTRTFFSTSTAESESESAQGVDSAPEEGGTNSMDSTSHTSDPSSNSSVTDADRPKRVYGEMQEDPHKVADASHNHFLNKESEGAGLEDTGFDISKVSKPSGDE